MRVLYVIDSLVPGGAERSLLALAPEYSANGVELEIAYLHDRPGLQVEFEQAGAVLHLIEGEGRVAWTRALTALIKRSRPDLVHTTLFESDVSGRVAARRSRVPVVTSIVSELYGAAHLANPSLRHWKIRAAQVVDALTARLAERIHAVSHRLADTAAHNLRYPRERIDVVPRGRDEALLGTRSASRRAATRRHLHLPEHTPVVLAVARHEHAKGLDVLFEALPALGAELGPFQLLVAGHEGGATADLRNLADQLGVQRRVTFLGGRDDVPDLLCAADVFVLTSRREGSPGSVIEAMALELPIVVADLPQIREVVDDSSAILVAPTSSPEFLAHSIARVFAEPDAAKQRVQIARRRFLDDFAIGRVAEGMVAFYDRALGSRTTSTRRRLHT